MKRGHPRWTSVAIAFLIVSIVLWEVASRIETSWYVALFAGAAAYIISAEMVNWWRDRDRETFTYRTPSEQDFLAHYKELQQYAESLGPIRPGMTEAAEFLLEEAKRDFERVSGSSASHEDKARAVLGIVAGATGALGVFGVSKDGQTIIPTPIIVDALIFVLAAFVCLLYVLRVKRYKRPDIGTYFAGAMVREELRVALPLSLMPAYAKMTAELAHRLRHEPRAIFIAYVATASAAVLVLLNVTTNPPTGVPRPGASLSSRPTAAEAPKSTGPASAPRRPQGNHS
jgi:hypothetical protein